MKKIILSLVAAAAFSAPAFSQGTFGPKVGLGISTFSDTKVTSPNTADSYSTIITPQLGIVLNAKLGDYMALRPELLYTQRGAKVSSPAGETTARLSYVELPFNIVGCIPAGPGKVEVFAGPSVAYLLGGNVKAPNKTYKVKGEDVPKVSDPEVAYYNFLNVSANFGLGYNWKGLVFQAEYNLGFTNLQAHYEDSKLEDKRGDNVTKASSINFAVIYLFGGKSDY